MIEQIQVIYGNTLVGRIALTKRQLCAFEYTTEWLKSGFSISPFELPLRPGVFEAKPHPFDGGFGVLDDCMPDGWGLLILDRYLQKQGIKPGSLTVLDRLALVGSTGRGALEFRPDNSVISEYDYSDFETVGDTQSEYTSAEVCLQQFLRNQKYIANFVPLYKTATD